MIGPGWMPSRPRPLVRVRRVLTYPSYYTHRRRLRRSRSDRWPPLPSPAETGVAGCFEGIPAALPTATLRAAAQPRHRMLLGDLQRWLFERWAWIRPRGIPLLVACAALPGMIALADLVKHPAGRIHRDMRLRVHIEVTGTPDHVAVRDALPPIGPPQVYLVRLVDAPVDIDRELSAPDAPVIAPPPPPAR
jgi:hypothetical protein